MEVRAELSKDLILFIKIDKLNLTLTNYFNSSIGQINIKQFGTALVIFTEIVRAFFNQFFKVGYALPRNQFFQWSFNAVEISHKNGYMQVLINP